MYSRFISNYVFKICKVLNSGDTNTENIIGLRRRTMFKESRNFDRSLLGLQPFRVYVPALA